MRYQDAMRAGFEDELQKIAGELQGYTRIGRKPIGVERLLEREVESTTTPTDVVSQSIGGTVKLSAADRAAMGKALALMGAGAGTYHVARVANNDRKLGRQMRIQSQMGQQY